MWVENRESHLPIIDNKTKQNNMNKKGLALLIIDGQNDFMDINTPQFVAALGVPGATKDMDRVVTFIGKNMGEIDHISMSLDSHRPLDIAHSSWWMDATGKPVPPFTLITRADLDAGKYTPRISPAWSIDYVKALEQQGEFTHCIWPDHCLIGSVGAALYKPLHEAVCNWEITRGIPVNYVTKGDNQYTEHFGIFRANIEMTQDPKTQFNQKLIKTLMEYDVVYLAGEAKSHCVVNSLRQAITEVPQLAPKIHVLEDCMSDVPGLPPGFYTEVNNIWAKAKQAGVQFVKSTDPVGVTV